MDNRGTSSVTRLGSLEAQAGLNAHELDLIARLEAHLRALHHTMRQIGTMHRTSQVQQSTCDSLHEFVARMLNATLDLKIAVERLNSGQHN